MGKYFPEPAPFALTEREQEFMDYITRELNRVSQTLLDQADISLDEKFVVPDRPQIGQIVYADGVSWNPGDGAGFYGYNGSTWTKFDNPTLGGVYVAISGDTMTGDLEINKSSASNIQIPLVNTVGAGAFRVTASGNTSIVFDDAHGFFILKDTKANIDAHTIAGTTVWSLDVSGNVQQVGKLTTATPAAGQEALIIPPGVAPSAPTNGSIWDTSAAFFARINGTTKTFAMLEGAQTFTGAATFTGGPTQTFGSANNGNNGIELGYTGGANTVSFIDFHTSATAVDYDSRIIASGNPGVTAGGTLGFDAAVVNLIQGNLRFPATQVPSAGANDLDDYEEGTFTPTMVGTTTAGTGTYTTQLGSYTKIGNVVYFRIKLQTSAHTGTGNMEIAGLPFTSANDSLPKAVAYHPELISVSNFPIARVKPNSTTIELGSTKTDGTGSYVAQAMDSACAITLTGHYNV